MALSRSVGAAFFLTGALLLGVGACDGASESDPNDNVDGSCVTSDGANVAPGTACATGGQICDGKGACVPCSADLCPKPVGECAVAACSAAGRCESTNVAAQTRTTAGQTAGDCRVSVCDGSGGTTSIPDDTDLPNRADECHVGTCSGGEAKQVVAGLGAPCTASGGKVCSAAGQCVGCNASSDCTDSAKPVCNAAHLCVAATCTDGTKNGDETGKDCGGSCGPTCETDTACGSGADCKSGVCTTTCQAPSCSDATKNGDETGADCGGSCAKAPTNKTCAGGEACTVDADCITGKCDGAVCVYATQGTACTSNDQCGAAGSNLCVDGFCCDTTCGSACQACSAAKKGGGADGACGNIAAGTDPDNDCNDEPASSCGNTGSCNGTGACQKWSAGTVCRNAADVCDTAETCPGGGAACPADAFLPDTTSCRVAAGPCDVAETCTGTSAACPVDAFRPNTTVCRASAGVCDVTERCTGSTAPCPANGFAPAGTVPSALQTPGDCQKIVCTGTNATSVTSADDVVDIPISNTACLIHPACDTSGGPATPYFDPAPTGTSCTPGNVCGDTSNPLIAGTCVECNTNANCAPGLTCDVSSGSCM